MRGYHYSDLLQALKDKTFDYSGFSTERNLISAPEVSHRGGRNDRKVSLSDLKTRVIPTDQANTLKMPMMWHEYEMKDNISQAACLLPYLQSFGHGTLKFTQLVTEVTCQRDVIQDLARNEGPDTYRVSLDVTCNEGTKSE